MPWVIFILVLLALYWIVVLAAKFWPVTVVLIVAGVAIYAAKKKAEREEAAEKAARQRRLDEQAEQERQRKAQEAKRLAYEQQQKSVRDSLTKVSTESLELFESLPKRLMSAEELLDVAEVEFSEGAFAPFWDSVERATRLLGQFDAGVQTINANSHRYKELTAQSDSTSPPFPVGPAAVEAMKAANNSVLRLGSVVRLAQRNFQFATIFEQRRTNQILVAGFGNLAQALDGMGSRISSSIDTLSNQVGSLGSTIEDSFGRLDSNLKDLFSEMHSDAHELRTTVREQAESLRGVMQEEARSAAERQERALRMLENLKRRRRP